MKIDSCGPSLVTFFDPITQGKHSEPDYAPHILEDFAQLICKGRLPDSIWTVNHHAYRIFRFNSEDLKRQMVMQLVPVQFPLIPQPTVLPNTCRSNSRSP
jgi:hypothetical protein